MPFQSAPNCAEMVLHGTFAGIPIANVINFQFGGAYAQSDLDALATVGDTWWAAQYAAQVSTSVTYLATDVRGLTSAIDLFSTNNASTGVGGVTGTPLPGNNTACISIRTGHTGRSARGRFYAWPVSTSQRVTTNVWDSAYLAALASALNQLRIDASGVSWTMIVLSRQHLGAVRPVAVGLPATSFISTDPTIDSQRGRLR